MAIIWLRKSHPWLIASTLSLSAPCWALDLEGIRLEGLMTIPPYFDNPEDARPYFRRLRELRDALLEQEPGCLGSGALSMGMSHDFEIAIEEGATMIRVGTALFGARA